MGAHRLNLEDIPGYAVVLKPAAFMADNEYEIAVGRSDAWDEIYWGRA